MTNQGSIYGESLTCWLIINGLQVQLIGLMEKWNNEKVFFAESIDNQLEEMLLHKDKVSNMNRKVKATNRSPVWGMVFLGMIFFLPGVLLASLSVSPSMYELKIPLGKSYTDAIRVTNVGKANMHVNVYMSDFLLNSEGKIDFFDAGTREHSLANYVRLNPSSFSLAPQEEKWVRFTLTVPKDLKGEYQVIIFFHTQASRVRSPVGKRVLVAARIGTTVYAGVKSTIHYSSEVLDLYLRKDWQDNSFNYALIYHNNGNIHVRPKGKLKILDQKGKKVISTPLNEKESSVLRNSLRLFEGKFQGKPGLTGGVYTLQAAMDFGKAELEVEKSLHLPDDQGIKIFEVKYSPPREDNRKGTVVFSARTAGIEDKSKLKNPANRFTLKSLEGKPLVETPAKIVPGKKPADAQFQGEWSGTLKPGIYFAELQIFLLPDKPLTSFYKLTVEE